MSKEDTAVAKKEAMDVDTAGRAELTDMFDIKENMIGVEPRLPTIKIIHQAQMFEMPDGEKVAKFEGTILDANRIRAWWEQSFDETGGGTPPDCFSMDAVMPDPFSGKRQSRECRKCEMNKWGSDGGRGKACKEMKRVHIVFDGELLPSRLTLPPSNIAAIDDYISLLSNRFIAYQLVVTEFSLAKTKNKDGITYAEIKLKKLGYNDDLTEARKMRKLLDTYRPIMRGQEIKAEEEL